MATDSSVFQNRDLYAYSLALVTAVKEMLRVKGGMVVADESDITEEKIVHFNGRMRVDGLAKFSERTVFSSIVFYRNQSDMDNANPVGDIVFYIPLSYIANLLAIFDYPPIEEDDEQAVLDGCGTITNLVAGYFVRELEGFGYAHLEMSHFESFINTAVNGVDFSTKEKYRHEIIFYVKGVKRFVAELTMGRLDRLS